jgi:hypothetical protein
MSSDRDPELSDLAPLKLRKASTTDVNHKPQTTNNKPIWQQ